MTIGECLDQIRKIYFEGDVDKVTPYGPYILKKLKKEFYPHKSYPRDGWLLNFSEKGPELSNKDGVRIFLDLSQPLPTSGPKKRPKKAITDAKDYGFTSYAERIRKLRRDSHRLKNHSSQ